MKRTLAALASTLLTACPVYDAEGKLIGTLPDAEIAQLTQLQQYLDAANGITERPKPTIEQLCSLRPSSAVKRKEGSDIEGEEIGTDEATTIGWVHAVIGTPAPNLSRFGADDGFEPYTWEKGPDGKPQGGLVLQYVFGTKCVAGVGEEDPRDCEPWMLKSIEVAAPQTYLQCWRTIVDVENRPSARELAMKK